MKKIVFIERKLDEFVSIEKVVRQIAANISQKKFKISFQKLKFGNTLSGIIKNLFFFKKPEADIYHISGHIHYMALVLPTDKTLLTIHDLRFLQTKKKFRRFILKKLFLDMPVKKLKYLTAISDTTKREIIKFTNCRADKIRVIENPLDEIFKINENNHEFNTVCPTILQIGTMENKNVRNLVKALSGINCKLLIIGKLDEQQTEQLKSSGIVYENRSNLKDKEIKSAYENADITAFCSTYEGFGLPIIESQSMRTPVITSNLSPFKEVSGGAAFLADPSDYFSIREGILKIINDQSYREKIISGGLENVKRFDAKAIARQYETIYNEILSETV